MKLKESGTENNMKIKEITERYAKPEFNETAPYMTIVKVVEGMGDDERVTGYYIQTAKEVEGRDWQTPKWMTMGEFLQQAFEVKFENQLFIDEVERLFELSRNK